MSRTLHSSVPLRLAAALALLGTAPIALKAAEGRANNLKTGCIERFDATTDYFPEKVVGDATGFSVAYHKSYKGAHRDPGVSRRAARVLRLLQCGAPKPVLTGELASAPVIAVPIKSMFSASTTHIPLLVDLGRLGVLSGVSVFAQVMSPPVLARIQAGESRSAGRAGMETLGSP